MQANDGPGAVGEIGVTAPQHGLTGTTADGDATYTPNPGYIGADSFDYAYFVGNTQTEQRATVTINVTPEPDVAVNDTYTVGKDSPATLLELSIFANDLDQPTPGDIELITTSLQGTLSSPCNCSLDYDKLSYTPPAGFTGTDEFSYYFAYTNQDGISKVSNTATVTITVTAEDPNSVAKDDAYGAAKNSGATQLTPSILANDLVQPTLGDVKLVTTGLRGTLSSPCNCSLDYDKLSYTPPADFEGVDEFTYYFAYKTDQGVGKVSNEATVTITVGPTDTPLAQVAVDDSYTVAQDSGLTSLDPSPLDNDTKSAVHFNRLETAAAHGTAAVPYANFDIITYTPAPGFHGTDSFQYSFSDAVEGGMRSNIATVTITVSPTGGGGGGGNLVDVEAICSGDVTFTNLAATEISVGYGDYANDMLEGEVDIPAGETATVTTGRAVLEYRAVTEPLDSEEGSIEIPDCSNGGGDDGDGDGDGDDHGRRRHGHLPDTGSPFAATSLLAAWLLTIVGSYLIVRSRRRVI